MNDEDIKTNETSTSSKLKSACLGSILTSILVTPLDVVKVRMQSQRGISRNPCKCFLFNGLMDHQCECMRGIKPLYINGTIDGFLKITRKEGLYSLWRGLSPTLVMAVPATMLYFTSYDKIKFILNKKINNNEKYSFIVPAAAGMSARIGAVTVVSPLELIRTRIQSQTKAGYTYKHIYKGIKQIINQNGLNVLWRGLPSTLLRDVPFSGIYWASYEFFKKKISIKLYKSKYSELNAKSSFFVSLFSGATSGLISAAITTPFDVIKTNQQVSVLEISSNKNIQFEKKTMIKTIRSLIKSDGFSSLWTGIIPRISKVSPACAIMISTYEVGKLIFDE